MDQVNLKIKLLSINSVVLINHRKTVYHISINSIQSILMNKIIISEISLLGI